MTARTWWIVGISVFALLIVWSQIMHALEPETVPYYLQEPETTQPQSTTSTTRAPRQLTPDQHDDIYRQLQERQRSNQDR